MADDGTENEFLRSYHLRVNILATLVLRFKQVRRSRRGASASPSSPSVCRILRPEPVRNAG